MYQLDAAVQRGQRCHACLDEVTDAPVAATYCYIQHIVTQCNTLLQHSVAHYNTQQHTTTIEITDATIAATHCNM